MDLSIYGAHRVLEPQGVLPQPAWKIDNSMKIAETEMLVDVETLNIDSASFTQIRKEAEDNPERIAEIMTDIVRQRGKHHNPVTGSGGMLIGTVKEIGPKFNHPEVKVGDKIATLVSLSLTPLYIEKIKKIHLHKDQVDIKGQAIVFASGIFAVLPQDMPEKLALSVLDVAGAPAQTARLVQPNQIVLIIGAGGKSGILCLAEARKKLGKTGKLIAFYYDDREKEDILRMGFADEIIQGDARDALAVLQAVSAVTDGEMADLTINCVNVPNTEMASILATKDGGQIYFFSMATSFTAAALGAEGVGKDIQMIIGNGYAKNHAEIALNTLRENPDLMRLYDERYA